MWWSVQCALAGSLLQQVRGMHCASKRYRYMQKTQLPFRPLRLALR